MPVEYGVVSIRELSDELKAGTVRCRADRTRAADRRPARRAEVIADRALLKRVLVNLVSNALRHSGSPEVVLSLADGGDRRSSRCASPIAARASCPGPRARVRSSAACARRPPSRPPTPGSACPSEARGGAHGGRIGVDSTPGELTSFWLSLPRRTR